MEQIVETALRAINMLQLGSHMRAAITFDAEVFDVYGRRALPITVTEPVSGAETAGDVIASAEYHGSVLAELGSTQWVGLRGVKIASVYHETDVVGDYLPEV